MDEASNYRNRMNALSYGRSSTGVVASFMNGVYAWMCVGLLVTAIVAWMTANSDAMKQLVFQPISMILLIVATLGLVWGLSRSITRLSSGTATALFVLYSALNGLMLSTVFLRYNLPEVGAAFLVTAGTFGITSVYGMVTKKDLSSLGSILLMALIGLILASIVNIFVGSSTLHWIVTYALVLVFVGLTAYDTQKLKELSYQVSGDGEMTARMTILGSLMLYLDFINLMLLILEILGSKRRD